LKNVVFIDIKTFKEGCMIQVAEKLANDWLTQLSKECPELSLATRESIVNWLLGDDLNRFEHLNSRELQIAKQAMKYRWKILNQRYLGVSQEKGYRNLINRLGSLAILRSKIQTWISLSPDRQRTVLEVLQEVLQDLIQSDIYVQQQMTSIAEWTKGSRLSNALLFASIEEYCLRPVRNQPLLVYRCINYLKRTQRGGLTEASYSDLLKLVSEEILTNDADNQVSLDDFGQYQDSQEDEEQELQHQLVRKEFEDYLQENLGQEAVEWLRLYLQGKSQSEIAKKLNKSAKEVYRLREKISYHAVRVFALKKVEAETLNVKLGNFIQENSLELTPKQLQQAQETQEEAVSHKELFALLDSTLVRWEAFVSYEVLLDVPSELISLGGDIKVIVHVNAISSNNGNAYLIEIPENSTTDKELNIILTSPGFLLDGDNTVSLPLDRNTRKITQSASFRLTALRPGNATITAELYVGETFETKLETQIQVTDIDEATFNPQPITTQPRPVPQPDFILQVQTIWDETNSSRKFQYQLKSFRFPSVFPGNNIYTSNSLSSSWIEQVQGLLANTLNSISGSLPQEGKSRLASLGQYLFRNLFPTELQSDFQILIPQNPTFTLLIIADQDALIPWELLHDGQRFVGERFIIGRWLQELSDTRPYEFPVGAVNVAHYANVENPELWATLLQPPGAPPPQPLPEGVLHDSSSAMRGLHLIRYSQTATVANRRNAPVAINNANDTEDIEDKMRPAKLNLRRNRPFITLGYVETETPELTALEQTWASAFIRAGCSGFTGSLWAVEPSVEAAFISCFYNRLWAGACLGEAFYTSRQLAHAATPDSLDWLAYVLFGDPMARPYLPVLGKGYAVVEPIGRDIDEPMPIGVPLRFRLSLRRTPPVWHEERVMEVAEDLRFENLQVHVKTFGLEVTPNSVINMSLAPTGNYLGWFNLIAPPEIGGNSALVQVFFMDGNMPIHSLMFSLNITNAGGESA
jgi:DNA-binding NarL/FixJ family response regulator